MDTLPALFISHGSPMTALEPRAAGAYFRRLGQGLVQRFGRPTAVLAVSAHTLAHGHYLLAAPRHETIHDFGGFPEPLYRLRYDAPGAPALAPRVAALMEQAGLAAATVLPQGGLDHGIWTPLLYVFPDADIPVLPLSFSPSDTPAHLFALGRALAPLADEGVLIVGSGSLTHNLRMVFGPGGGDIEARETPETAAFRGWVHERTEARDWPALLDYRKQAPHARLMHPTDEHWLPFYVAAGAGGPDAAPRRLHASLTYGCLAMDLYAFGKHAAALGSEVPEVASAAC